MTPTIYFICLFDLLLFAFISNQILICYVFNIPLYIEYNLYKRLILWGFIKNEKTNF